MGVRRWLQNHLVPATASRSAALDLLSESPDQISLPALAGIDLAASVRPWSVTRLESIMQEAALHPSALTLQAARQARHCLSVFWLAAPTDQLEELYASAIGDLQRLQLAGSLVRQELARDEQRWCDQLAEQLNSPGQRPRHLNLLLALMPYTRPGKLALSNPLNRLPNWLLGDYIGYCEPALEEKLQEPVGLLEAADAPEEQALPAALEPLTEKRGDDAMDWFQNDEALSQMTDLINRYSQDSSDENVLEELSGLRCVVAQLWLDIEESQIQSLYEQTSVGLVTRSLITCNFGQELFDEHDRRAREALTPPKSPAGLIAMMLFYPLGAVDIEDSESLPDWLNRELNTLQ